MLASSTPVTISKWISPTQVIVKKNDLVVIQNENGEMVPTRIAQVGAYASTIENLPR